MGLFVQNISQKNVLSTLKNSFNVVYGINSGKYTIAFSRRIMHLEDKLHLKI